MKYSHDFTRSAPTDYAEKDEASPLFKDVAGALVLVGLVFLNVVLILGL